MPLQSGHLSMRLRRRLRRVEARLRYRLGLPFPGPSDAALSGRFRHPIDAAQMTRIVERYRTDFPSAANAVLADADRLLRHHFNLLGHESVHGERIAWSRDPVSGRDWPRGFSPDIAYRGPSRLGDIKLPWELNKHQYFFTLGKAAWLSGERRYSAEIVRQIDHWIDDNPFLSGINWISALEVGARAISWILAFPFYAEQADDRWLARLAGSIARHMQFIEEHLSISRYTNTHLVGEAAALVIGGLFLRSKHSDRWIQTGLTILDREAFAQVTSDGMHVERSFAYHRFFLDNYYLVSAFLRSNGRDLAPATRAQMVKTTEFLMRTLLPDGTAPAFSDGDDARALWFREDAPSDYRNLLAIGAVLFARGDFKAAAHGPAEDLLWLMGPGALDTFAAMEAGGVPDESVAYPDAGYFVLRGGAQSSAMVFDCSPVGHGPSGHGHADALSYQLYAGGYQFLVDPGTYSYNIDYEWRESFRSTRSHNTLVVDGENQSVPLDRMSWKTMAAARLRAWRTSQWFDIVDGEHDGYHRLPDPVTHRRVILFIKPATWLVVDIVDARRPHVLEVLYHVRPDCGVHLLDDGKEALLRSPGGADLHLEVLAGAGAFELVQGDDVERNAWFSPRYGVRQPTTAVRQRWTSMSRARVVNALWAGTDRPVVTDIGGGVQASVVRQGTEERMWYGLDGEPLESRDLRFDGSALFQRLVEDTQVLVHAQQFRELDLKGFAVRSDDPVRALTLEGARCVIETDNASLDALRIDAPVALSVVVNGRQMM